MMKKLICLGSWVCVCQLGAGVVFADDTVQDCRYGKTPAKVYEAGTLAGFQRDDVFRPLLADPKQPQFYAIPFQPTRNQATGQKRTIAAVSFGEYFGLATYQVGDHQKDPDAACNRFQVGFSGAVFSQFDLGAASKDLINADYVIGIPISYRYSDFSFRFRPYHQSSHVGDEFLIANLPKGFQRLNYSYEELEFLASYDRSFEKAFVNNIRLYSGGGWMFDTDPHLKSGKVQWGVELRSRALTGVIAEKVRTFASATTDRPTQLILVAGADFKSFEHLAWNVNSNVVGGFELYSPESSRRLRILVNYYNGFNPYGQFFSNKIYSIGVGVYLTL